MPFEIIDGLTMADIAFRASGIDYDELFMESGRALLSIMLDEPGSLRSDAGKTFMTEASEIDLLLYSFLQELIFFKDSESLLLVPEHVEIARTRGSWYCACRASGETIDHGRHNFITDIKSVTMHNLKIWQEGGLFYAQVVVDV